MMLVVGGAAGVGDNQHLLQDPRRHCHEPPCHTPRSATHAGTPADLGVRDLSGGQKFPSYTRDSLEKISQ
ncbi:hypothetical protein E2C01_017557 [Portunus trituberculatus]|uniref:Uncharacterized protein n=1 Tax=Portunus trituberculatus TaxID=210409 RepID=A0A5B7DU49_PORTR|nr:hypothetical protein [Portunus trituberculatus]